MENTTKYYISELQDKLADYTEWRELCNKVHVLLAGNPLRIKVLTVFEQNKPPQLTRLEKLALSLHDDYVFALGKKKGDYWYPIAHFTNNGVAEGVYLEFKELNFFTPLFILDNQQDNHREVILSVAKFLGAK